jgi:hypothetical protein
LFEHYHFNRIANQVSIEGLVYGVSYGALDFSSPWVLESLNPECLGYYPDGSWGYKSPLLPAPILLKPQQVLVFDFGKSLLDDPPMESRANIPMLEHLKIPSNFFGGDYLEVTEESIPEQYPQFWEVLSHYRRILKIGLELICRHYLRKKGIEGEFTVSVPPLPNDIFQDGGAR